MTATTAAPTGRLVRGPVTLWYRDTVSCLQATFASVLLHAGHDPVEVLGAGWDFLYKPGDVVPEEFYYPCRTDGDLGAAIAPHHPVGSRWIGPGSGDAVDELVEAVARDELIVAAVDNFHLPFRPAYGDVHAAHLVVVYGIDPGRGLIYLSDAMPPAFSGPIRLEDFRLAWGSENPRDEQDVFFSDADIGRRHLAIDLGPRFPEMTGAFLASILENDLAALARTDDPAGWSGLAGLARFTGSLEDRLAAGDATALTEAYGFGWGPQAQSSLRGELLRTWGARHGVPAVAEAGRLVDSVAHRWTGLRLTCAHGRTGDTATAHDLARHARLLRAAYDAAAEAVARARESL